MKTEKEIEVNVLIRIREGVKQRVNTMPVILHDLQTRFMNGELSKEDFKKEHNYWLARRGAYNALVRELDNEIDTLALLDDANTTNSNGQ